jgi:hypothetical protein
MSYRQCCLTSRKRSRNSVTFLKRGKSMAAMPLDVLGSAGVVRATRSIRLAVPGMRQLPASKEFYSEESRWGERPMSANEGEAWMEVFSTVRGMINKLAHEVGSPIQYFSIMLRHETKESDGDPEFAGRRGQRWHLDAASRPRMNRLLIAVSKNSLSTKFRLEDGRHFDGGESVAGDAVFFRNVLHRPQHNYEEAGGDERVWIDVAFEFSYTTDEATVLYELLKFW